jgi:hypothetical protein
MFKRTSLAIAVLFLLTLVSVVSVSAASSTSHAPQAVTLSHKVTLWGETSIDGPALASFFDNFEGIGSVTIIGWTGTDTQHHLNLIRSSDDPANGVTHFKNKLILKDTSFVRPAVVYVPGPLESTVVAWTGTDAAHTLNVIWDAYGTPQKLTLRGETSISAPALTYFNGNLLLAWTGTDTHHSLNILPIGVAGPQVGTKTVLSQFSSLSGPTLSAFSNATSARLVLNWTTSSQHLNQASSTDGTHFTAGLGATGLPQLSATAPSSQYHQSEGGPEYWIGWTGTDTSHHLNLQWTAHFPQWPDPASTKTALTDSAFAGPQIAFNDGYLIAWTGTDTQHTLNLATFEGF